jgi:hypothetical protein
LTKKFSLVQLSYYIFDLKNSNENKISSSMSDYSEEVDTILDDNFTRFHFIIKHFNPDANDLKYSVASSPLILGTEEKYSTW